MKWTLKLQGCFDHVLECINNYSSKSCYVLTFVVLLQVCRQDFRKARWQGRGRRTLPSTLPIPRPCHCVVLSVDILIFSIGRSLASSSASHCAGKLTGRSSPVKSPDRNGSKTGGAPRVLQSKSDLSLHISQIRLQETVRTFYILRLAFDDEFKKVSFLPSLNPSCKNKTSITNKHRIC